MSRPEVSGTRPQRRRPNSVYSNALTAKQRVVLVWVEQYIAENGFPPTLREIQVAHSWGSTNAVSDHLRALVKKGCIQRRPLASRGIRVLISAAVAR